MTVNYTHSSQNYTIFIFKRWTTNVDKTIWPSEGHGGRAEGRKTCDYSEPVATFLLSLCTNLLMSVPLFFSLLLHFLLSPLPYLTKPQVIRRHNIHCKNIKSRVSATLTATTELYKISSRVSATLTAPTGLYKISSHVFQLH
jgi:hypothetical protein